MKPQPTEAEVQFILDAISEYLTVKVSPLASHHCSATLLPESDGFYRISPPALPLPGFVDKLGRRSRVYINGSAF